METIPTGAIGHTYSDGDELINQTNKEMLPAILSSAKTHQKHADHFLRTGAMHGNPALIIKGHLHDIVSRTLCNVLGLYDCNSIELGELVEGTQDWLTTDELYHLCSPDYSNSQVSCVIGHLEAGGIIKKSICEYWELINE